MTERQRGGATLPCPHCNHPTSVLQTRLDPDETVRRERVCYNCNLKFSSVEHAIFTVKEKTEEFNRLARMSGYRQNKSLFESHAAANRRLRHMRHATGGTK